MRILYGSLPLNGKGVARFECVSNLVYWVNLSKRGGKNGVFQGLAGLLRGISRERSLREIPRSSLASPRKTRPSWLFYSDLHSISNRFFDISVLAFLKCMDIRIGLPKMHGRFRIGLSKVHGQFRNVPPQVSLNLLPLEFHIRGILSTIAIMKEKQHKNLFQIEWNIYILNHLVDTKLAGLKDGSFNKIKNPGYMFLTHKNRMTQHFFCQYCFTSLTFLHKKNSCIHCVYNNLN